MLPIVAALDCKTVNLRYVGTLNVDHYVIDNKYNTFTWCNGSEDCKETIASTLSWLNGSGGNKLSVRYNNIVIGDDIYYFGIGCNIDYIAYTKSQFYLRYILGDKITNILLTSHITPLKASNMITVYKGNVIINRPE